MARQRMLFTEEFEREAVRLVDQWGSGKANITRDLGVSEGLLARRYREQKAGEAPTAKSSHEVSVEGHGRMRRELAKVKTKRDILKKTPGYFAAEPK